MERDGSRNAQLGSCPFLGQLVSLHWFCPLSWPRMGVHRRAWYSFGVRAHLFVLFGVLVLLSIGATSESSPSRRQMIRRQMEELQLTEPKKIYRIGVKIMPPMCFYDPTLPEDQRFSGVRFPPP